MGWNEIEERLKFFMNFKTKVHINLFDGTFLNGFIIKKSKPLVWIIKEDKLGDVFIFVKDIKILRQNTEVRK